jgi:peptide/nickel transport system substrate-binding protein
MPPITNVAKRQSAAPAAGCRSFLWSPSPLRLAVLTAVMGLGLVWCLEVSAQDRLIDQLPFDRITLDDKNDNAVLEIQTLDKMELSDRPAPDLSSKSGKLKVKLLDNLDAEYEVQWYSIAKLETFEQMILDETKGLVSSGKMEEAYDNFKYLFEWLIRDAAKGSDSAGKTKQAYHTFEEISRKWPGLAEAFEDYLYEEAKLMQREGKYDAALAKLREMHDRKSKRTEVENALGLTTDKLVEGYVGADKYLAARILIDKLADWYPQHEIVKKRSQQLQQEAASLLDEARQAMEDGRLREAASKARRMQLVWPRLEGAREVLEDLHARYPHVTVGVTMPAVSHQPGKLADWAARRGSRLVYRTLTEFIGPSIEGGKYICPMGQVEKEDLGRRLAFKLDADLRWASGDATLTGYDLSRQLLAMADPNRAEYSVQWGELLAEVAVRNVLEVDVKLHRASVLPEALLQTIVTPYVARTAENPPIMINGPYSIDSPEDQADGTTLKYLPNIQYFANTPTRPKEITERHFTRGTKALLALRQRDIDVLDRVNPWDLAKFRDEKDLVLKRYAAPLVHCLIPNMNRPLTSRRGFRRALVFAINREAVLDRLLDGEEVPGCQVVSGPFSCGVTLNDPLSYAYDESIAPRRYEPRLAVALAQVALQELAAETEQELTEIPQLVLGHADHEIARIAVNAIQRQLKAVGIPVVLEALESGIPQKIPDSVDLLYAELAVWEPLIDARRLLGNDGPAGGSSPYMDLALRQLEEAPDWPRVGRKLRQIHRIAHVEVAIVPLWQLTDHLAHHRTLQGIDDMPVSLYQNVENWRPGFYFSAEEK